MNNWVYCLTVYNGSLIAGGIFSTAGGVSTNGIAQWNGTNWQSLGSGIEINAAGYALTNYNGNLIAGGGFATAVGVGATNVAQWNGTAWQALGRGMNDRVRALTVYK